MDIDDVNEWITRGIFAVIFFFLAVEVIMILLGAINEVAYQIRRRRQRQRQSQSRATTTTTTVPVPPRTRPPPSPVVVEALLQSIPDVAYQELPSSGGGADGDSDRESCVICVTPYEAGEACSVLPACKHLFHKACVAKWLRVKCTCPLCRAAVALPLPRPSLQGGNLLNAAENMV